MKKELKELTEGMQRLCAVANRIVALKGEASRIETDLLLEDLRRLYDVALRMAGDALPEPSPEPEPVAAPRATEQADDHMMAMMSTMAALVPQPSPQPAAVPESAATTPAPTAEVAPAEPTPEPEPVAEPAPMPTMEELEQNDNALLFDEIIIEPAPEPAPEPVQPEPEPAPEPEQPEPEPAPEPEQPEPAPAQPAPAKAPEEPRPVQASLLDYLQKPSQRTLGESLATQHTLQSTLERKVDDLRTVININDRFSFMSELFHNNIKAYNDFIMTLNGTATRAEALALVAEVAAQQKWDNESATVKTFHKILDKKF